MIDTKTYDPCLTCKHKPQKGSCATRNKYNCPTYNMIWTFRTQPASVEQVPDEFFVEELRRRGWKGELKQLSVIEI